MISERYTLTLRHELINLETGEKGRLDPPLSVSYIITDSIDRSGILYAVNNMLQQLEHEFLIRMDGEIK